jgi:outer membrane protein insertion porin family
LTVPGSKHQRSGVDWIRAAGVLGALAAVLCVSVTVRAQHGALAAQPAGRAAPTTPAKDRTAAVDSDVDEPLRYILDDIEVSGNTRTSPRVILRFVPFVPGNILDVDDPLLTLTRYRLLGTGFFRDVTLSLEKGSKRGHVILNVEVVERNTIILNDLWMGLAASADSNGQQPAQLLSPFAGFDFAESNLLGTGMTLGAATAFSENQSALAIRFLNPAPTSGWMLSSELLLNDGLGFFGNSRVRWDDPQQLSDVPRQAVVSYRRIAGNFGVGRDLSVATQLWFNYRLESTLASLPHAAAHEYGGQLEPIDFHIHPGRSLLSTLGATLVHDTRDAPILPTTGFRGQVSAELSLLPTGSDYSYQRIQIEASRWWPTVNGQVFKLYGMAGAIAGYAPFYEQYYVSDLSDFRPGRVLGLGFDDRPPPNFLDTSIAEVRYGDFAAKIDAEYRLPIYRGSRSIYGIDIFVSAGVYSVAGVRDIQRPPRNLSGAQLIPIDLTGNFGFRMDTSLGGISFSFANLIGFIPVVGEQR